MSKKESGTKLTLYNDGQIYRVRVAQIPTDTLDFDNPLVCPYCGKKLAVCTELIKYGVGIDRHTYTFLCKRCLVGFMYLHSINYSEDEK